MARKWLYKTLGKYKWLFSLAGSTPINIVLIKLVKLNGLFPRVFISVIYYGFTFFFPCHISKATFPKIIFRKLNVSKLGFSLTCQFLIAYCSQIFISSAQSWGEVLSIINKFLLYVCLMGALFASPFDQPTNYILGAGSHA